MVSGEIHRRGAEIGDFDPILVSALLVGDPSFVVGAEFREAQEIRGGNGGPAEQAEAQEQAGEQRGWMMHSDNGRMDRRGPLAAVVTGLRARGLQGILALLPVRGKA